MLNLSEKELQNIIIGQLSDGVFKSSIIGIEELDIIKSMDDNPHLLPGYQIDFQLRSKYAKSALSVLESLDGAQLISGEKIQNISIQTDQKTKKERLYPDIVLGNSARSTFAIMELKKDSQTEREAITELLAYTIELKNHLPHIADKDINLVIISKDFNTLLDHSITSLLLGSKFNLLALQIKENQDKISVCVYIPRAWTDIWQNNLPPNAFSSITLSTHKNELKTPIDENLKFGMFEILEDLIMFEGARNNSHGFYLIWHDTRKNNSDIDFCITLYQINPLVFLQSSLDAGFKLNTGEPLSKYILENTDYHNIINSLYEMAYIVKMYLSKYYDITNDAPSSWSEHMALGAEFRMKALPFAFNAWGYIGEFIRYYFFHPSLPNSGMIESLNLESPLLYKDPTFGIETINRISDHTLFNQGVFNIRDIYKYAKQLTIYCEASHRLYETKLKGKDYTHLKPHLFFSALDILCSQREITYRTKSSCNEFDECRGLKIWLYDVDEPPVEIILKYTEWFVHSFLKNEPFYQQIFPLFGAFSFLYTKNSLSQIDDSFKTDLQTQLLRFVKDQLKIVMEQLYLNEGYFAKKHIIELLSLGYFNGIDPAINSIDDIVNSIEQINDGVIIETFEVVFIEILNLTIPEIFHELTPITSMKIDWENLKLRLIERFSEGERFGTVFVLPNGGISIGVLNEEQQFEFLRISDPTKEVILYNNMSGVMNMRKVLWEELINDTLEIG